jgi:ATP/maltotriose-dependent transcriptional regulator MalT/DNA-binding SARP family transcriptional activator
LTRRLSAALDRGALFLVAPAGSGKTTALEEALSERGGDVGRIRCTALDRHAGRLLDHVVEVVRVTVPGAADVLAETLARALGTVSPEAAVRELVIELERLLSDPLTLFFDDAEHIADDAAAAGVVGALVASGSRALRVAVASRRPLPLRLAKLRASGRLTLIAGADLAFSAEECEALLRLACGNNVVGAQARSVLESTEGWPLGVALALGVQRAGSRVSAAARSAAELSAFLVEEVLDGLDGGFRAQLLKSCLPAELTPRIAAAIGLDGTFLTRALDRHLFLRPVPEANGECRLVYHPLFREFLLERQKCELGAAELRRLHADLAAAISDERPLEAVEHWLAAGREPEAVRLAGRHSQPLVRSSPAVVRDWIGRLSTASRAEPTVRLLEGQLAMGEGRPGDAVALLRSAAETWERRGSRAVWTARFALAQTLIVLGRFDEVPPLAQGFDEPETATVVAAPMVALWAAIAIGGTGRRTEGEALLRRAVAHPLGGLLEPVAIAFQAFYVDWHAGRLDAALEGAERAIAVMEEFDPVRWLPFTLWYAAYVQEARGEHAAAVTLLERSRDATRRYGLGAYPAAVAGAIKAGCDARAGRLAAADAELARAAPQLTATWHGYDLELARAELAARKGDAGAALVAAERAYALVRTGSLGERLRAAALLTPLLAGVGARLRARDVVEDALAASPGSARLLALRAWLGDGDGARDDICAAWEAAGDQVRYLVRAEWPRIEPLTWEAVAAGRLAAAEVVGAVLEAFPSGAHALGFLDHPNAAVRRTAASAVAASGHPDAAERLAGLTADPVPAVAAAARAGARRLTADPPPLRFTLLGTFGLWRGRHEVAGEEWERRVAARLTRFLLVHRDAAVPEDVLFDAFWPNTAPVTARRGLQVAVSAARGVLDTPGTYGSRVETRERTYRLALRPGDLVDSEIFEHAARAALAEPGADRDAVLASAAALWSGTPLPEERYECWSAPWRDRLVDLQGELLAALADSRLAAGDPFGAAAAARRHVELDPLCEAAHGTLMVAFARGGRRGHALRQFLDCRRALGDHLGVEPAARTRELQRAILAGEPV